MSEPLSAEPAKRAADVVERVVDALALDAEVRVEETGEEIHISVDGPDDPALLIGKHGATIDALQHIAGRAASHGDGDGPQRVIIDAGGYRERRQGTLQRLAGRAVEDALSFGRPVELDPMNSFERRVVHTFLKDRADVETYSEGEGSDRRIVVAPVER